MIRFGVLALLLAVAAGAQPRSAATLSGRIIDSATRAPIGGATIAYRTPTVDSSIASDPSGAYTIHISPAGPLTVNISKSGYATIFLNASNPIPLKPGDTQTHDFELRPAGRFTGRVLDRDTGEPIAGVSVIASTTAWLADRTPRYDSRPTAADGSFSIADVDSGEYRLEFDPPPNSKLLSGDPKPIAPAYGTTWFPGVPRMEMAASLTLASGESRAVEMKIQKRALHHIAGAVEFPEGMDPQAVQLELAARGGGRLELNGDFPRGGKFHVDGVEEGSYVLHASTSAKSASDRYYASQAVELTDRDVEQVRLVLRRAVTLHAVFTMAEENLAVPKGVFVIHGPLDPWPGSADPGRANEWRGLPPGEYRPLVMGTGMRGHAVASMLYGGKPVTGPIDVEAADSTITIVLTSKPGRIAGTLRTPDSQVTLLQAAIADLIMNADLTTSAGRVRAAMLLANKPGELPVTPDAAGRFRFDDLAPGRYQAVVLTGNDRDRFIDAVFLREALRSAPTVTVEAERTANLELTP